KPLKDRPKKDGLQAEEGSNPTRQLPWVFLGKTLQNVRESLLRGGEPVISQLSQRFGKASELRCREGRSFGLSKGTRCSNRGSGEERESRGCSKPIEEQGFARDPFFGQRIIRNNSKALPPPPISPLCKFVC